MEDNQVLIEIYAAEDSDGWILREELPAIRISEDLYKVMSSPGLALNIAKGDIIRPYPSDKPSIIVEHGGNVCAQFYFSVDQVWSADEIEWLDGVARSLNGSLDGIQERSLSFTVPVTLGFERMENIFNPLEEKYNCVWYYSNVFQDDGVTPLNWWSEFGVNSEPRHTSFGQT